MTDQAIQTPSLPPPPPPPPSARPEPDSDTEYRDEPGRRLRAGDPKLLTRSIRRRRSVPIMGYIGTNGQGKTLAMVRDSLPSLAAGRRILSTVAILDPATGQPHRNFERFTSWDQLHGVRDTDILMDEISGVLDARDGGMPRHIRILLPQLRRANVTLRWTGISWDNTDKRLRQITQAVARCKGFAPNRKLQRQNSAPDAVSLWAPNRAFMITTFDAQTLQSADDDAAMSVDRKRRGKKVRKLDREWFWGPGSIAFDCYNTLDSVSMVDAACVACGGRVREPICKCTPDQSESVSLRRHRLASS